MTRSSKLWPLSLSAALVVALSVSIVSAAPWTGPTQTPPGGNTSPPINTSPTDQTKTGGLLNVYNLWVDGALGVTGGVTAAQYCFTGGIDCIAAWPTSQWTLAGTDLYYTAGKVGIGTTTPGTLFSVQGVANLHTATSTFYSTGGINIKNGCFAVNGVCISGGSGSGSLTTLSVTGTNNVNPLYPDGLVGTPIIQHLYMNSSYTVPAGKTLYITSLSTGYGGMQIRADSSFATFSSSQGAPIIVGAGSTLSVGGTSQSNANISGILVNSGVTPIIQHLYMNSSYTVPAGKTLYITSLSTGYGGMQIRADSSFATFSSSQGAPIIVGAGSTLSVGGTSQSSADISGYLTDASGLGGP